MSFDQYQLSGREDITARRKAEEVYRNQKAQADARKEDLLKKQRKIRECQEQIQRLDRYAERALLEGQEQKAAVYLERKVEWESRLAAQIQEAGFHVSGEMAHDPQESQEQESSDKV